MDYGATTRKTLVLYHFGQESRCCPDVLSKLKDMLFEPLVLVRKLAVHYNNARYIYKLANDMLPMFTQIYSNYSIISHNI